MCVALACGFTFGAGLAVSGLTRPEIILGFLDVTGRWDPTLPVVLTIALVVQTLAVGVATKWRRPLWSSAFVLPTPRGIDRRLIGGAAIFGTGWGLVGVCPGPALVSVASGAGSVLTFVAAMTAGIAAVDAAARRTISHQIERSHP
jgi:uncharacterized protein